MLDTASCLSRRPYLEFINMKPALALLIITIAVYAFAGEPTPARFGWIEVMIAFGLVGAVGVKGAYAAIKLWPGSHFHRAGTLLLLYGLVIGVLNGLMRDNALSLMIRDIIPFLFLFLPLFLWPLIQTLTDQNRVMLTAVIVFAGFVFALRVIYPGIEIFSISDSPWLFVSDPTRLANAPTVLFAAFILLGLAFAYQTKAPRLSHLLKASLYFFLALIPLAAMVAIQQRASVAYIVSALAIMFIAGLYNKPYRMVMPIILLSVVTYAFAPFLQDVLATLGEKHTMVGLNQRGAEARAVIDAVDGSLWTVLLGHGWGATIASPAVGGTVVNFTHSLVTATWLKTGIVGVVLLFIYLFHFVHMLYRLMSRHLFLALALTGPFLIDVFLYASYKSLDFGLILFLIVLWADRSVLLNKAPAYSTQ